jgi:hypothetical protein
MSKELQFKCKECKDIVDESRLWGHMRFKHSRLFDATNMVKLATSELKLKYFEAPTGE